ncbi:MAG: hypothetical protein VX642_09705 [Bdellovibrionota bacterium]|nr:hypothetical protein [Bdellovibrionota bacterium]
MIKKLSLLSIGLLVWAGATNAQYNPFDEAEEYRAYKYQYLDANLLPNWKEAIEKKKLNAFYTDLVTDIEKEEQPLNLAEKMVHLGMYYSEVKQYHLASIIFERIAEQNIGNRAGEFAISQLSKLLLDEYRLSEEHLIQYFTKNAFESLHPDNQSFVSYYRSRLYFRKSFKDWAKEEVGKVSERSPWYYRLKLHSLIHDILNRGEQFPFNAIRSFYVANSAELSQLDLNDLYLISARFLFEQGEFEKAFSIYKQFETYAPRLSGQILLEMAWTKYYQQDYSHALGLLRLLDAPYFAISRNSERYLVKALIYRQLCHYEKVELIEKQFLKDFAKTYETISSRFNHERHAQLVNEVLLSESLSFEAKALSDLQKSIDQLPKTKAFEEIVKLAKARMKNLEVNLTKKVEEKLGSTMESLLVFKQEIGYLSYLSKLDRMRTKMDATSYESEKAESFKFEKLFWRTNGEFWLDEIEDYRVLIDSKCQEEAS